MSWRRIEDRLALLELLVTGQLKRRRSQASGYDWLAELSWTQLATRRGQLRLVPPRRHELVALLDRVWPSWRADHIALLEVGEPPTPRGWRALEDQRRRWALPELPERINRHTAAALTAPHAKSTLTPGRLETLGDREVVGDGVARLRPPPGLVARCRDVELSLDPIRELLGEVGIPERSLRDGLTLHGHVRGLLLVENLGPWADLNRPEGVALVHVPGWDTTTVRRLLPLFPDKPVALFGDLDPNGVRIFRHLRAHVPDLRWVVPDYVEELLELYGQDRAWPGDLDCSDLPVLVRRLAASGRWLEQERVAMDSRLLAVLEQTFKAAEQKRP